jgi:hypothetical protein
MSFNDVTMMAFWQFQNLLHSHEKVCEIITLNDRLGQKVGAIDKDPSASEPKIDGLKEPYYASNPI